MLVALLTALSVCGTPGPNNIICAAIGARRGYRGALSYSLGVTIGFPLLLAAVGFGLGTLINTYPQIQDITQMAGTAFLIYLAYRIATAPPPDMNAPDSVDNIKAYGFSYAVMFQWINPKALSFAFSLVALYTRPDALLVDIPLLMLLTAGITLPITMLWALLGDVLSRFLQTPLHYRLFNAGMGGLLLAAAVSIFIYQR